MFLSNLSHVSLSLSFIVIVIWLHKEGRIKKQIEHKSYIKGETMFAQQQYTQPGGAWGAGRRRGMGPGMMGSGHHAYGAPQSRQYSQFSGPMAGSTAPEGPWDGHVQSYLFSVLASLGAGLLTFALSVALWPLGGTTAFFLSIVASIALTVSSTWRTPAFFFACACYGGMLQDAIWQLEFLEPGIIASAAFMTALLTGAIGVCALNMKDAQAFMVASMVSAVGSCMFWFLMGSWLLGAGGSAAFFNVYSYGGLLVYGGMLAIRIRSLAAMAAAGYRKDPVLAAFDLFRPIISMFIRILAILAKNSGSKKRRR